MTPNTQKRLRSLMLSSQIILIGISLGFSVMTLVITVLQPVFVMAAQFSPWFDRDLAELLHLKNSIWQNARQTHTQADWLSFRQMRNKCTQAIWKAKVSYFKEQFSLCGSNPKKFWKTLPMSLNVDDVVVTDKEHMAELFNQHFIKSGFLFDSAMPPCPSNIFSSPTPSN
ncbi:unnamed protein product, partial [Coregonus sp. 'balchen']